MLNIPNSIKNLFKTDGTRKNFRVHFPGGELPDITNDSIVRESVHFTESICSQSTFRFGLAEASVIEFETVGIPNMYGYTIECAYEIDTSSLSAAEISAIQADHGDGELVLASASDIGYGFYRVPLGVFRVEKCPRNHGAMTHRQVTAYQYPNGSNLYMSPPQQVLMPRGGETETVQVDLVPFIYSNLGYYTPSNIDAKYNRTVLATETGMTATTHTFVSDVLLDVTKLYRIDVDVSGLLSPAPSVTLQTVLGYSAPVMDYSEIMQYAEQIVGQEIAKDEVASALTGFVARRLGVAQYGRTGSWVFINKIIRENEVYSFYPRYGSWQYLFPQSITITLRDRTNNVVVASQTFTASTSSATLYQFTPISTLPSVLVDFPKENTDKLLTDMMSGLYETLGEFGKADRLGGIEDFALSPSSPLAISPGDYDECWWDEYDVSPIGTVTVTYRNGEEGEATANVTLGAGASLYDMTDNEVLKNLSTADLDSITTLLSGDFAANAQNVGFTPVEMTMQGWPWMEAGDSLQITAEDGTIVNTYALRVEMSGIQHLMSDITAEGGEIIGEV